MRLNIAESCKMNSITANMLKFRPLLSVFFISATSVLPLGLVASEHAEGIQVEQLAKNTVSWNRTELPEYPKGKPEVTILRITIPAHTALPAAQTSGDQCWSAFGGSINSRDSRRP